MSRSVFDNPFSVQSPEEMTADDMKDLFVGGFTDFEKVPLVGHTFLHGPRGCGKSMMFRNMQPDSQCASTGRALHELDYFAAYVPIKNMGTSRTELIRLEGHAANYLFNEHVLCVYILEKLLAFLNEGKVAFSADLQKPEELADFYNNSFAWHLHLCGHEAAPQSNIATAQALFANMQRVSLELSHKVNLHIKQLSYSRAKMEDYNGPICGYHDFLFPVLIALRRLPFMPKGPIYLLIDDADNLNLAQTKILNSWVATRTHAEVSIKVSTQLRYKTFRTFSGQSVDTPHDYSEINISTIYTSHRKKYYDRVREIVSRRLRKANIDRSAEDFFPEDPDQVAKLDEIKQILRERWDRGEGIGYRKNDDVTRYARPDLIKSLGGASKSTHTYSYSGFEQLVHISSGIVRHFLEPASQMFSEEKSRSSGSAIRCISPTIQNEKIRDWARAFLFDEMDRLRRDQDASNERMDLLDKLANLLTFLGGAFTYILCSDKTERRVFSIAFSNSPDKDVLEVFKLGVEEGYFHESTIGNKEGTGRTRLFVMSRRLAPCFNLDPTSFAGYWFVTNDRIKTAMYSPQKALRELSNESDSSSQVVEQLALFDA